MTPPDFPNAAPSWPDSGGPPSRGKTLIGGVPWADQTGAGQGAAAPVAPEFAGLARAAQQEESASKAARTVRAAPAGGGLALEWLSWQAISAAVGKWFHEQVLATPAWSISMGVHVLLLLALALFVVRDQHGKKLRLSLSFSGPAGAEAPGAEAPPIRFPVCIDSSQIRPQQPISSPSSKFVIPPPLHYSAELS
jgi:hypothetical protein